MRSTAGHRIKCGGVPPFGHPGITVRLSTPPGLSQIPTSFIGSRCQGIHRAPLETSTHEETKDTHTRHTGAHAVLQQKNTSSRKTKLLDARVHYTVLKQQPPQPAPHRSGERPRREGGHHTPPNPPPRGRRGRGSPAGPGEKGGAGTAVPGPNSVPRTPPPRVTGTPHASNRPADGEAYW